MNLESNPPGWPAARIRGLLAVLAVVLAATGLVVTNWGSPAAARADCVNGTAQSGYIADVMGNFAWEGANYSSTCDGDGYYAGALKDVKTDGYCVRVYFYDAGYKSYEGKSCTTSGNSFNYVDRSGDTVGLWCVGKGVTGSTNWCLEQAGPSWPGWSVTASGY